MHVSKELCLIPRPYMSIYLSSPREIKLHQDNKVVYSHEVPNKFNQKMNTKQGNMVW